MFQVNFYDVANNIVDTFSYSNLFDALRVAKETMINGAPALTDEDFNKYAKDLIDGKYISVAERSYMVYITRVSQDECIHINNPRKESFYENSDTSMAAK